ncbi:MAG: class I SAM-dependent methyltransferase [Oscillospiraceae bacterium]|nr:class I SAM-dependent methyltransferase [Oscillospiraceae bacterium]
MNEDKFSGKAEIYDKYRPSYPTELTDWLYIKTRAQTVADIGAGTGKFTKLLLDKPWKVTAVEPNRDMLVILQRNVPQAKAIEAPAENTGIPDHTIDLVTAATAFHWFDEDKFREECKRIMTESGRVALIFNQKITDDVVRERDEISRIYCGYKGHAGKRSHEEGDAFLRNEYFAEVEYAEFEHSVSYDEDGFVGNTLSRSYALKPGDVGYEGYVWELRQMFKKRGSFGSVELKYKTTCYLGRF